jgi:hypothetical protein
VHEKLNGYACRCAYKPVRKDLLTRHLGTCRKPLVLASYECKCHTSFIDRNEFAQHVSTCGAKIRGRPPKRSASPALRVAPATGAAERRA